MSENHMTSAELIQARAWLGLSTDTLAADLGLPPAIVAAWETDRDKIPVHIATDLRWRAAAAERLSALAASGLSECEWVQVLEAQPVPTKLDARTAQLEQLVAHENACLVCRARKQFITDHFPPMPPRPMSLSMRATVWVFSRAEQLPRWAQPAVPMALAFGGYSLIRIALLLPQIVARPLLALIAIGGLAASMAIGGALGVAYGLFRLVRERVSARSIA